MKHQQRPIIVDAVETEEQCGERVRKEICDRTEFIAAEVALQTQMLADSCREGIVNLMRMEEQAPPDLKRRGHLGRGRSTIVSKTHQRKNH